MDTKIVTCDDLMIGDWVEFAKDGERRRVEQIISNYQVPEVMLCENKDFGLLVSIEDIWPISITEKILEKNGFVDEGLSQGYEYRSKDIYICVNLNKGLIHCYRKNRGDVVLYGHPYVHDLQHALRSCGIDKEMVL